MRRMPDFISKYQKYFPAILPEKPFNKEKTFEEQGTMVE